MARPRTNDGEFDSARLRQMTDQMIDAITSPGFVEAMRQLRQAPVEQRLAQGAKLLNPAKLRTAGVPLPDGMRITSRYFEPGKPEVIEVPEGGRPRRVTRSTIKGDVLGIGGDPLSWGACACGGGLSFCGGAGGST